MTESSPVLPADGASPATQDQPWPVAVLSRKLGDYIDRLGQVWIEGELTQWNLNGKNVYAKIKDLREDVTLSFNIWGSVYSTLTETFAQGDRVILLAKPKWWGKGGSLNLSVTQIKHVGLGELLENLEKLRAQLASEGLFDADRKQPLPFLPNRVGLVTGKDSDAEKDVVRNARLRWPGVQFEIAYAAVQGEKCVPEVVAAIQALDANPDVDVIIVARGGGDFQNLLGFSDERVVRAAAAAGTPIVSAIGHEADRPLLDEVADLRASTPTDAAKRVVPDVSEELSRVDNARNIIRNRLRTLISHQVQLLEQLRSRPAVARPDQALDVRSEELTHWVARGHDLVSTTIERAEARVAELRAHLRGLSPQATLDRGFAIVESPAGLVRQPDEAPVGSTLRITLARGVLAAESRGAENGSPTDA